MTERRLTERRLTERRLSRRDALKAAVAATLSTAALAARRGAGAPLPVPDERAMPPGGPGRTPTAPPFTYNGLPANQHGEIPTVVDVGGPFHLPPLPYAYDALEPFIDAETMRLHYDGHHAAYVKNLNAAVAMLPREIVLPPLTGDPVVDAGSLIQNWITHPRISNVGPQNLALWAVGTNGGGHYNHSLFWRMMKPGGGGQPTRDLAGAIDKQLGSYSRFQAAFTQFALAQFGSGWVWVTLEPGGSLQIETTRDEGSPLMYGRTPLLGLDVWEHAYYLKYRNRRAEYVAAWWHTVNWDFVNQRYDAARKA